MLNQVYFDCYFTTVIIFSILTVPYTYVVMSTVNLNKIEVDNMSYLWVF